MIVGATRKENAIRWAYVADEAANTLEAMASNPENIEIKTSLRVAVVSFLGSALEAVKSSPPRNPVQSTINYALAIRVLSRINRFAENRESAPVFLTELEHLFSRPTKQNLTTEEIRVAEIGKAFFSELAELGEAQAYNRAMCHNVDDE